VTILRLFLVYAAVTALFALSILLAAFVLGLAEMGVRWLVDVTVTGRRLNRKGGAE
jgi:hypothetical protein